MRLHGGVSMLTADGGSDCGLLGASVAGGVIVLGAGVTAARRRAHAFSPCSAATLS
jgi:hypothetical protein